MRNASAGEIVEQLSLNLLEKNMTRNQKARERQFLDEVCQLWPAFPIGEIIEGESPDFLIRQDTRTVGVEVVDYVRGQNQGESTHRRNEVLWQKIANVAKQEFEAGHSDPLMIHFLWNHRYLLRQSEVVQLAREAKRLVESHIPVELFEQVRIGSDNLDGTILDGICHSITITRVRNTEQSLWSSISSGFIGVQVEELQSLIDTKNAKIQYYLERCDVVWLLIVADGRHISSNINLSDLAANNTYTSPFEQVLVYDRISKRIFLLELRWS